MSDTWTANAYVRFTVPERGTLGGTRFRIVARNFTDSQPPLSSGSVDLGAYLGPLYNPYGHCPYSSIGHGF